MIRKSVFLALFLFLSFSLTSAQNEGKVFRDENIQDYRRSSLYSVLIAHTASEYADVISEVFETMETPDKFNNHDIMPKCFNSSFASNISVSKRNLGTVSDPNFVDINSFIAREDIPRRLVAKWFERDSSTGAFNLGLIYDRGYYDASFQAIERADASIRGRKMLADAGFELIGNTFMIVNDITFIDHGKRSSDVAELIRAFGSLAGTLTEAVTGDASAGRNIEDAGNTVGAITEDIAGFKVKITTYLYRLQWDNEVQGEFFSDYWISPGEDLPQRKAAFDTTGLFKLSYVGHTVSSAQNLSSKTFSSRPLAEQFLRVCTRAVDNAVVELQRKYDEFKVNVPIYEINEDGSIAVKIGLKEGVNTKSKYEVLVRDESSGVVRYKTVGIIKPVKGKIWDNRFGAKDEAETAKAEGEKIKSGGDPYLGYTSFKVVSKTARIEPGMLIREKTIKRDKK